MLEQICQTDQYFWAIVEARRFGVAILDLEGHVLSSNDVLQTLLGYSAAEFVQKRFVDLLVHRSSKEINSASIAPLYSILGLSEQVPSAEKELVRKNGSRVWVRLTLVVGHDAHSQPQQAIALLEDLTEMKQTQSQLCQIQKAIERQGAEPQEICLRSEILRSLEDVVWSVEPETGKTLYVSPSAARIYGYSVSDFLCNSDLWFEVIHPDDRAQMQALTLTLKHMGRVSAEYRIVRSNGEIRWVFDRTWLVQEQTGQPAQLYGIVSDITERKRAEAEIVQALEREKELNQLKSRFLAIVTHEFRTPLSAILCAAELLDHYGQSWTPAEQHEQLQIIQTLVKHLSQLLDDVLLLGKTEKEHLLIKPVWLDVVQFCNDLLNSLRLTIGKQHPLCLVTDLPNCPVYLDTRLLRQILTNLLSNAIKYSPQGGTVQLHLSYEGGNITFQVQDEGIGIPAEEQSHLFDFFYRATNVGTIAGTGLGLAIVKQCVDCQNGQITVTSQTGVGSTFTVTLPLSDSYSYS